MSDIWDRKTGFCCDTCAYFVPKTKEYGRCRRNSPTMAGYPVVSPVYDWCGEHKIGNNPSKEKAYGDAVEMRLRELKE